MLSSTPSRFRRPEGFPPSYFGNRLAGEDPVRQSRHPEPTVDPGPVQEGVVVEQRTHASIITHIPLRRLTHNTATPTRRARPQPETHTQTDEAPHFWTVLPYVPDRPGNVATFSARRAQQAFPSFPYSNPARC